MTMAKKLEINRNSNPKIGKNYEDVFEFYLLNTPKSTCVPRPNALIFNRHHGIHPQCDAIYKQKRVLPRILPSTTHPTTITRLQISLDTSQGALNLSH